MEPYDQSHSLIDETGDENFGDDNLDDTNVDDTDDYSMMEGGVGEEEPQAGTSTDGAGEGQDKYELLPKESKRPKKRVRDRMRFVHQGFVYHNNVIGAHRHYEHKKSGCRGRAIIPVGGGIETLKITQPHNHPPDPNAEEKDLFLRELKAMIQLPNMQYATLKQVYETVAGIILKFNDRSVRSLPLQLAAWGFLFNGFLLQCRRVRAPWEARRAYSIIIVVPER
ncbi:hypothetical protein NQ317_005302 [Molorchus minor]|uniref:FLYWCH-type domain-containing protein n=1 Tax=Molorchus minor TaxID=1323400 RepID=A0ABQ9IXW3_9CUCU|nr:hypothetical protein NQ317_005302 [Molorchus minor]